MKKTIGFVVATVAAITGCSTGCSHDASTYEEYMNTYSSYVYEEQKEQEAKYKTQLKELSRNIPSDWDAIEKKISEGDFSPLEEISKGTRHILEVRDLPPSRLGEMHFKMSDALLEMMEISDDLLVSYKPEKMKAKMKALKKAHIEYLAAYSQIQELGPPKETK